MLDRLIYSSCYRISSCSTLCFLSNKGVHNLCIVVGLKHWYDFSTNIYTKSTVEKLLMWYWYYNWWSWTIHKIYRVGKYVWGSSFDKSLQNGSTWIPNCLIQCGRKGCFQVVYDQHIWDFFDQLPLYFPWENKSWFRLRPLPWHYCSIFELHVFLYYWSSMIKNDIKFCHFHSCFHNHRYTSQLNFSTPNPSRNILSLVVVLF